MSSTRTATPAESWHVCSTEHQVRVIRRSHRRYLACVYKGEQREVGRTLIGDFPSIAAAVAAAQLYVQAREDDDGERLAERWAQDERRRAVRP